MDTSIKYLVGAFIAYIIIKILFDVAIYFGTKFEKVIIVKDKYIRYRRRGSNYNVVTQDGTIYQISNLWFQNDFNRAEDYNQLQIGSKYKIKGYGYRVGFADIYKKIYSVELKN